jgi:hypothetical protein
MDSLVMEAARAPAAGDPLGAVNRLACPTTRSRLEAWRRRGSAISPLDDPARPGLRTTLLLCAPRPSD